jgi:hypothetical protein
VAVSVVRDCGDASVTYPSTLSEAVEAELVGNFSSVHGVLQEVSVISNVCRNSALLSAYGQILLVGEHQEESVPQLVLVQHSLELLPGLNNTVAIVAVDNEDDTLGVLEVMPPERTNLVLTADIPHGELNVLVLHGLDVETCRSNCQRIASVMRRLLVAYQW